MNPTTLTQRALVHSARTASRLFASIAGLMALYIVYLLAGGLQQPLRLVAPVLIGSTAVIAWSLHRRGQVVRAMQTFIWAGAAAIVLQAVLRNGLIQPALYALPVIFLLTGWVLGLRQGVALAVASMVSVLALAIADAHGWLAPRLVQTPYEQAIPMLLVMAASVAAMVFILQQHWHDVQQTEELNESLQATVGKLTQRESELQQSEKRFHKLNSSIPLPIAVNRLSDGRYLFVNEAWCRTFGWESHQAIGQTSHALKFWRDKADLAALMDTFRREGRLYNQEFTACTATGDVLGLLLNAEFIEFDGQPSLLAIMLDQTERQRIENQVRSLNAELEQRVQDRTAELSSALDMLKRSQDELVHSEKLASLGSLVAGVAHELNTPIGNALVSASALADMTRDFRIQYTRGDLRRSVLETYLAQCEDGANLTQRSLQRANELVHSFKQVAVDQSSERRRAFDLGSMLQEVVDTLRPNTKGKPWTIALDIAPDIAMEGYPGPLGQVVINLVMNALLHAFEGRERGEVLLQATPGPSGWVTLICRDDGVGIAPENLPRIFDPFFTTRLGQGGSGLGLAIVHRLVGQVLQGEIAVESTPGQGTRFVLRLPLVVPELTL